MKDLINNIIIKLWKRFALHGIHYKDKYKKLNWLYYLKNPWELTTPAEKYRYEKTNELIQEYFGKVASLLEVGCGESYQSIYLKRVCDQLYGLDVSKRAIERAKLRCPSAKYFYGDIYSEEVAKSSPYDLVLACEVLYYVKDIKNFLYRANQLGKRCFFSYISREINVLDPIIKSFTQANFGEISYENITWRIVWWSNMK
jgi:2-polyprenyl-3-methyl-5-hydroxy-6-metoxy-1,4-benzoquinol methylase